MGIARRVVRAVAAASLLGTAGAAAIVGSLTSASGATEGPTAAQAATTSAVAHTDTTGFNAINCDGAVPANPGVNTTLPAQEALGTEINNPCFDVATGTGATIGFVSVSPSGACTTIQYPIGNGEFAPGLDFAQLGSCTIQFSYTGDYNSPQTWNVSVVLATWLPPYLTNEAGRGGDDPCSPFAGASSNPHQQLWSSAIAMAATPDDGGYWIADAGGLVDACGDADSKYGYVAPAGYANSGQVVPGSWGDFMSVGTTPEVAMATTADGGGYWIVSASGEVGAFGDAQFYGDMSDQHLNAPIVAMAADPATGGYWLVASDGGVFSFNAPFYGSTGDLPLNSPVVGMAATPNGQGYWFVASDGGVFAYGNAQFHGSMGNTGLNKPVVGMATDTSTGGYWLVASDGGVFSFNAPFYGSTGNITLAKPIVDIGASPSGSGYRFVASDGGIFCFGSAGFHGSAA